MAVYKLELRLGNLRPGLAASGKENDDAGEDMGHLVLREQDLFGDAAGDGVLPESWGRVINRISDKVEFECAGFRYIGPEIAVPIQETDGNNALSNLPKVFLPPNPKRRHFPRQQRRDAGRGLFLAA
jgi:hypothetical protein